VTIALWCLLVVSLLPIACAGIAKWGFRGFDNNRPREWLAAQQGWRARANAAQQNSWEALAMFAAAVLAAHVADAPQGRVDGLALAFVGARVAYIAAYVGDRAPVRSLVWLLGVGLCIALFAAGG
jgi:uncharacterized MAPEG superfamily protein